MYFVTVINKPKAHHDKTHSNTSTCVNHKRNTVEIVWLTALELGQNQEFVYQHEKIIEKFSDLR